MVPAPIKEKGVKRKLKEPIERVEPKRFHVGKEVVPKIARKTEFGKKGVTLSNQTDLWEQERKELGQQPMKDQFKVDHNRSQPKQNINISSNQSYESSEDRSYRLNATQNFDLLSEKSDLWEQDRRKVMEQNRNYHNSPRLSNERDDAKFRRYDGSPSSKNLHQESLSNTFKEKRQVISRPQELSSFGTQKDTEHLDTMEPPFYTNQGNSFDEKRLVIFRPQDERSQGMARDPKDKIKHPFYTNQSSAFDEKHQVISRLQDERVQGRS